MSWPKAWLETAASTTGADATAPSFIAVERNRSRRDARAGEIGIESKKDRLIGQFMPSE
jgi:hypothetical protein